MAPIDLPDFETVSLDELRQFWIQYPDPNVRRLILEVARYRMKIREIDKLYCGINNAWREEVGGHLFALYLLKKLAYQEMSRMGETSQQAKPPHTP